ncbi:MAG TPA: CRISPR system precrRNA processing endoribonuclease RAMP protein Cas6, partial [Agitococcus sp.]|nr:CRISPR system precrRNA processing endoribonuclease RAMP protein Cas6 [Agitococcus sp.]
MLPIIQLKIEITQQANLQLPEYAGSMLRGAFGHTFKRLACITKQKECKTCPLYQSCAYSQVFEGVMSDDEQHSLPYVIQMPQEGNRFIAKGQTWSFGMVLMGNAINQLPIIAYAWQKACEDGFSKDQSKAQLLAIYQNDQIIYQPNKSLLPHQPHQMASKPIATNRVHLDFVSPLRIQHQNYIVLKPEELTAPIILIALAKRIQRLAELHANPVELDLAQLLAAAQQINIEPHLKRATMTRYSNRQQRLMNLDGLIGRISLTGDLSAFNELLTLGQQVHLGKNATMGLG